MFEFGRDGDGDGPFVAETTVIDLMLDNLGDAGACFLGGKDLPGVNFSAATGSTLSIAP